MHVVGLFINDSMELKKSYIFLIKTWFPQKTGSTIIGTPGLILCANTPGKDHSHEPFTIICDKVREHMWKDFWPFLHAEHFRIIDMLGIPPSSVQTC